MLFGVFVPSAFSIADTATGADFDPSATFHVVVGAGAAEIESDFDSSIAPDDALVLDSRRLFNQVHPPFLASSIILFLESELISTTSFGFTF